MVGGWEKENNWGWGNNFDEKELRIDLANDEEDRMTQREVRWMKRADNTTIGKVTA